MSNSEDDDYDRPQLSAETLKALNEFYEIQNQKLSLINDQNDAMNATFEEDWVAIQITLVNFHRY